MKYGRLTVIARASNAGGGHSQWLCRCACGNEKVIPAKRLRNGSTISCGCAQKEAAREIGRNNTRHGLRGHPLYNIWRGMKKRCFVETDQHYPNYGARGITMCEEWKNSFERFYSWAIANGYEKGLSIDRVNNDGNYEPSNCRWATAKEQANNRRKPKRK